RAIEFSPRRLFRVFAAPIFCRRYCRVNCPFSLEHNKKPREPVRFAGHFCKIGSGADAALNHLDGVIGGPPPPPPPNAPAAARPPTTPPATMPAPIAMATAGAKPPPAAAAPAAAPSRKITPQATVE